MPTRGISAASYRSRGRTAIGRMGAARSRQPWEPPTAVGSAVGGGNRGRGAVVAGRNRGGGAIRFGQPWWGVG